MCSSVSWLLPLAVCPVVAVRQLSDLCQTLYVVVECLSDRLPDHLCGHFLAAIRLLSDRYSANRHSTSLIWPSLGRSLANRQIVQPPLFGHLLGHRLSGRSNSVKIYKLFGCRDSLDSSWSTCNAPFACHMLLLPTHLSMLFHQHQRNRASKMERDLDVQV